MAERKRVWRVWVATCAKTGKFLCGGRNRQEVADYRRRYNSPVLHRARLVLDAPKRRKAKGRK